MNFIKNLYLNFSFILMAASLMFFISCTQPGVVVTPDPNVFGDSTGCFAFLGGSIESGGPLLKQLCTRDIDKILTFSNLTDEKSNLAKRLICGEKANPAAFKKFFDKLSIKEKTNLIRAFEFYGYNINGYGC